MRYKDTHTDGFEAFGMYSICLTLTSYLRKKPVLYSLSITVDVYLQKNQYFN